MQGLGVAGFILSAVPATSLHPRGWHLYIYAILSNVLDSFERVPRSHSSTVGWVRLTGTWHAEGSSEGGREQRTPMAYSQVSQLVNGNRILRQWRAERRDSLAVLNYNPLGRSPRSGP